MSESEEKGSLTARIYRALKEAIITCELRPGEMVHENVLATEYGVSKSPVRDALHMLRQEGYVEVEGRRGYIVSTVSLKDVQDVYQLRLILEPPAAALAAGKAEEEQLQEIAALSSIEYDFGDHDSYREFLAANRNFHTAVARASGNPRLAEVVERLLEEMERFFHLGLDLRDSSGEMAHEHQDLVDALKAGRPDEAESITRDQIVMSRKRVIDAILAEPHADVAIQVQLS